MEKMKMHSYSRVDANVSKIEALFPNCVTEVVNDKGELEKVLDFDALKEEFSTHVVEGKRERYQFTWPDKNKAKALLNQDVTSTLRPCRAESVDFDNTENLYIEGDNLEVLKLLQETYLGKIKMIYIDPPYNTGNDFLYNDAFSVNQKDFNVCSGDFDSDGNRLVRNLDSNGRFHTDWLNMIYPRLRLAKDLLSENGIIFISIDDNEYDNLKKICDEIFGSSNYLGTFVVNSTPNARDYGHIGKMHEYALFYGKNSLLTESNMLPEEGKEFKYHDEKGGYNIHPLYNSNEAFTNINRPNLFYPFYLYLDRPITNNFYEIGLEKKDNSIEIYPPKSLKNQVQFVWRWGKEKSLQFMNEEIVGYKMNDGEFRIVQKMRHTSKIIRSLLLDTSYSSRRGTAEVEEILKGKYFSFPKPISLLKDFVRVGTNSDDYVLDFFSGSSTTAHAVMEVNAEDGGHRKFIMVQMPELIEKNSDAYKAGYKNICDIGKTRIKRAGEKILASNKNDLFSNDLIDRGFRVFKLDSSNMNDIYYKPSDYSQDMLAQMESNIKSDRTPEDLLFQVMLDLGVELSSKIDSMTIKGKEVFNVAEGWVMACFDEDVSEDVIIEVAKQKPRYFVMRDSSMVHDTVFVNFDEIFNRYSPETIRKVM